MPVPAGAFRRNQTATVGEGAHSRVSLPRNESGRCGGREKERQAPLLAGDHISPRESRRRWDW